MTDIDRTPCRCGHSADQHGIPAATTPDTWCEACDCLNFVEKVVSNSA